MHDCVPCCSRAPSLPQGEAWYEAPQLEPGVPAGMGQWGDRAPFTNDPPAPMSAGRARGAGVGTANRAGDGKVQGGAVGVGTSGGGGGEQGGGSGEGSGDLAASLAIEARALFESLAQLHHLMTGPRGHELSPKAQLKPEGGFTPPCQSPASTPGAAAAAASRAQGGFARMSGSEWRGCG